MIVCFFSRLVRGKVGRKCPIIINENQDILDEDVARERDRVLAGQTSADIIVLDSLSKVGTFITEFFSGNFGYGRICILAVTA